MRPEGTAYAGWRKTAQTWRCNAASIRGLREQDFWVHQFGPGSHPLTPNSQVPSHSPRRRDFPQGRASASFPPDVGARLSACGAPDGVLESGVLQTGSGGRATPYLNHGVARQMADCVTWA
ncbi:hypothetical protein GCM10010228_52210 [Streptomyces massasporeus]|nr:hypothetical protein GCM10010228_52210 [Streptomyces massasporeus]